MPTSHFDRSALPPAQTFYERELGQLRRPDRKGWARPKSVGCPFHNSKSGSSFFVNVTHGAFYCFSCNAKGSDVIDFVQLRYRLDFASACKQVGVWRDMTPAESRQVRRLEQREQAAQIAQREQEHAARIAARDELHRLEREYSHASDRLTQLQRGEPERHRGEQELAWWYLADTLPRIREAEADYWSLAGFEVCHEY